MIQFNDVTKRYHQTTALDQITLNFKENKIYCLIGRNGAGKTTLLKLIAGYIKASSGSLIINDKPVGTLNMPGCVNFIESRASQFNDKVERLIQMANTLDDHFDMGFAQEMLRKFNLDINKKYLQLSFGMQTMLTTLISLASNAEIVLLDEPVLGLDAMMRSQFYELLNDSFERHPRLIIVSTHLVDEIAKSAQELIILDKGKVRFQSSVFEAEEKAYSVTGFTKNVLSAIRHLNVINLKTIGAYTTAYVFDAWPDDNETLTIRPLGLQDLFINLIGGDSHEIN